MWLMLSKWRAESQGTSALGGSWVEGLVMYQGDALRGALELGAGAEIGESKGNILGRRNQAEHKRLGQGLEGTGEPWSALHRKHPLPFQPTGSRPQALPCGTSFLRILLLP